MNIYARRLVSKAGQTRWWFGLLAVLVFAGEWLGYAACQAFTGGVTDPAAWVAAGTVALVVGAIGALLLDGLVLDQHRRMRAQWEELRLRADSTVALRTALAEQEEWQRRLRHDLRGVLSPALLTADRLSSNTDPKVQRAGSIMVAAVEKAAALIATKEGV